MYHVITNLELMFGSLEEAEDWARSRPVFEPRVPATAMQEEDRITPRICGCLEIRDCITSIGVLGTFRRCMNANEDAKSYENDNEAYPIMVAKFSDDGWEVPTEQQVPDIRDTRERWLLKPARPEKIYIRWLDAYSIKAVEGECRTKCTALKFLQDIRNYSHPWLDGKGHPLDCAGMGGDPWPDTSLMSDEIYADMGPDVKLGFAVPAWPLDGTWIFTPFDSEAAPYRTYRHRLRKFSGCLDAEGIPIFEGYVLKWGPDAGNRRFGTVSYDPLEGWRVTQWKTGNKIPLTPNLKNRVEPMTVYIGHDTTQKITVPDEFLRERENA